MGSRNIVKSALLIVGVFVVLIVLGSLNTSTPSQATTEAERQPTTTTTTEPPPEGITVVRISNGAFRPSNLTIDLNEIWIVQWINEDPREYTLADNTGAFETTLGASEVFEFDYSTLEPGIHRYNALIGLQRIPGSVDTRPEQ
ncbi:MAG: hypothetical protein BMS9Abin12_1998 [Acidimicrobiia bacterium]|nr:MAG: hypothetical protein BMS9Abin12_1998 [Acidimicrobiia bacterium]